MSKWEYTTRVAVFKEESGEWFIAAGPGVGPDAALNELGEQDWELAGALPAWEKNATKSSVLIFKRPKGKELKPARVRTL